MANRGSPVSRVRLPDLPPPDRRARRISTPVRWVQLDGSGRPLVPAAAPPKGPALWGIAVESIALVGGVVAWRSTGSTAGLAVAGAAAVGAVLLLRHV